MSKQSNQETITATQTQQLHEAARQVAANAYEPYSHFAVGAAVLTEEGKIFTGVNVENVSYSLTICAERSAIFSAVTAGARRILAIAIYTPTPAPTPPCGACRQVLNEFGPNADVFSICDGEKVRHDKLDQLLPGAFGSDNL